MSLLDHLPGVAIERRTSRRRGTTTTRRLFRFVGARPGSRHPAPSLFWRLAARLAQRLGGRPACPICRHPIEQPGDWLCSRCGTPLFPGSAPGRVGQWAPQECPTCGRTLDPAARYCPQCQVRTRRQRGAGKREAQIRRAVQAARAADVGELYGTGLPRDPATGQLLPPPKPVPVAGYQPPGGAPVQPYTRRLPRKGGGR